MGESNFDKIKEGGRDVPSGTQHADIADTTAPAALTAVAAAGANPTKAEFDALLADVTALRLKVAALVTAQNTTLDVLDDFQETA